ncbi:MAG: hypothetical protein R3360_09715, partial [Alphaproteobacteria bacterium]|nr:hypothetical protein [Alphaproteobacteria bacterium]
APIAAIAAFIAGPLVYHWLSRQRGFRQMLDVSVMIIVTLMALVLIPDVWMEGGWVSLIFIVLGLGGPLLAERLLHRAAEGVHAITLIAGTIGFVVHALADGAALNAASGASGALMLSIVLHRLPAGLVIWWVVHSGFGRRPALIVIGLLCAATLAGYWLGEKALGGLDEAGLAWFRALVIGSVLHLTFHRLPGRRGHSHKTGTGSHSH